MPGHGTNAMQIELYDPSPRNVRKTSKRQSETSEGWTPRKNADFCISNGVWPTIDVPLSGAKACPKASRESKLEDIEKRIHLNLSFSHASLLSSRKKLRRLDLRPVQALALDAIIKREFKTQSDAVVRSACKGVLTFHAIINDLVNAGLEPVRATDLLITFGPHCRKQYRTMTENSQDYWVKQLIGLNTRLDRHGWSRGICLAKLLAERLCQSDVSPSLEDLHDHLGYKFACTTCFPKPLPANYIHGISRTVSASSHALLHTLDSALQSPRIDTPSPTSLQSGTAGLADDSCSHHTRASHATASMWLSTDCEVAYGWCPQSFVNLGNRRFSSSFQPNQERNGTQTSPTDADSLSVNNNTTPNSSRILGNVSQSSAKRSKQSPEPDHISYAKSKRAVKSAQVWNAAHSIQEEPHQSDEVLRIQPRSRQIKEPRSGQSANLHSASSLGLGSPRSLACIQNSTTISEHVNVSAQDEWLQTFAQVEESDPNDIVNVVLCGWDIEESGRRFNSFFLASPHARMDIADGMHKRATMHGTKFPYASQQVFIRMPVLLPYESAIFSLVQSGDIDGTRALLRSGKAPIDAIDPYGLGFLYYASYYCWRGHGPAVSFRMCRALLDLSVNAIWCDEIGNTPEETLLDNMLCARAIGDHSSSDMMSAVADIAILFDSDTNDLWTEYRASRDFTEVHDVLLKLSDDDISLPDSLRSLNAHGELASFIDRPDRRGRSPLAWACEHGLGDAARVLIEFGADPNQSRRSVKGASPLLHLAVAGPGSRRSREVVKTLLRAGVDVNAKDDEQWTAMHVAASWDLCDIAVEIAQEGPDLSAVTDTGCSALDLAVCAEASDTMIALLRNHSCY